jgi:chlorobactene glucosyltransferase
MIYLILSTAFFIGGIFVVYWLHNQYHLAIVVEPMPPPIDAPLISVCIPARNEERNIRACVEAVLAQDYPNLEIIVLDDRSMDRTPEILADLIKESGSLLPERSELTLTGTRASDLHVIKGIDLPPGWAGKPHALYQAAATARGDWFCFIDADTFLSPAALSSCLAKASETRADMFTIITFQVMGSFWEKVVMPLVMTALSVGFSPRKVNDPKRRDAIANGQFILIKRPVYNAIGGHESVKDQIVEDKAISEQVKCNGYRLIVADGHTVVKTRMYTSLPEMWEGWTKNIYLGLRDQKGLLYLGVFGATVALLAALFLPVWPILGLIWGFNEGGWMAWTVLIESLIFWGYLIAVRARVAQIMEISPFYAFTTPLGAAVFAAMMITSAFRVISGKGVSWKGRLYAPK